MNRAERRQAAKRGAVDAAISIADDVTSGQLAPEDLDQVATDAVRDLAGTVIGPGDPLWELQVGIAKQVLAHNGIEARELAEWLTVLRRSEANVQPEATDTVIVTETDGPLTSTDDTDPAGALGEMQALPDAHSVADTASTARETPDARVFREIESLATEQERQQ